MNGIQLELLQSMRRILKLKSKVRVRGMFGNEIAILGVVDRTREESPDGLVRVADIVQELQIPAPGVSRMLGHLEQRDVLRREADPKDRRSTLVQITPTGEKLMAEQRADMTDFLDRLIAKMGEEKVRQLTDLLNEMNQDALALFAECEAEESERRDG